MHNIQNKKIAIIGGGPGGLTLARLLQIKGADVKVYERDAHKDARPKGATLDLHEESGLRPLKEAGLMAAFMNNYRPGADKLRIVDKHATILFEDAADDNASLRLRPEIDRGPLQQLLLESLQPNTVVWDSQVTSLKEQHGSWMIVFKNGKFALADIVIGADGANSKVRAHITAVKPLYSGVTAIEGAVNDSANTIPAIHSLLNGGKIFAMGDDHSLIVSAKGDGSLVFYPSFKVAENWIKDSAINFADKIAVLDWFKKEYGGWNTIWQELFQNASGSFIPRPIYSMPVDQSWETLPNITLLGDAAHLMPPFAGEGVNMAMLDAVELCNTLTDDNFSDVHAAIEAYEKQMRLRAADTTAMSLESTAQLHSSNAIDFLMQVVG